MAAATPKQRALDALSQLPEDATLEEAIERLCFIASVEEGLQQSAAGETISHDEAKRRLLG
jgi:predicted transcriptional regulator